MIPANDQAAFRPFIVGLGGTTRAQSSSELAVRHALAAAESLGAEVRMFDGPSLVLPLYDPTVAERTPSAQELIAALRRCDGVIVASPGYHGSISGLIKNALDYTEDMRADEAVYFDGRAMGCIAAAYGWQATGTTLAALRSIAHALRAWPTPLGVAINSLQKVFGPDGACTDEATARNLAMMAEQVVAFARMRHAMRASPPVHAIAAE